MVKPKLLVAKSKARIHVPVIKVPAIEDSKERIHVPVQQQQQQTELEEYILRVPHPAETRPLMDPALAALLDTFVPNAGKTMFMVFGMLPENPNIPGFPVRPYPLNGMSLQTYVKHWQPYIKLWRDVKHGRQTTQSIGMPEVRRLLSTLGKQT